MVRGACKWLSGNADEKFLALGTALSFPAARTATNDPFVYRLGLQIFILARRVRLPYGSPVIFP
jgi:hypothetical protein